MEQQQGQLSGQQLAFPPPPPFYLRFGAADEPPFAPPMPVDDTYQMFGELHEVSALRQACATADTHALTT